MDKYRVILEFELEINKKHKPGNEALYSQIIPHIDDKAADLIKRAVAYKVVTK